MTEKRFVIRYFLLRCLRQNCPKMPTRRHVRRKMVKNPAVAIVRWKPFFFGSLGWSLFIVHAFATPPQSIKGLIVVYDGRTLKSNAPAYEYVSLQKDEISFKACLSDGRSISGLVGQIVSELNYLNGETNAEIARMETVSQSYAKAKPVLSQRISQLRAIAANRGITAPSTGVAQPQTSPSYPTPRATAELENFQNPKVASLNRSASAVSDSVDTSNFSPLEGVSRHTQLVSTFNSTAASKQARIGAISELAISPEAGDIELFIRSAYDKDDEFQTWGIRGLGKLKSRGAFEKLLEIYHRSETRLNHRLEIVKQIGRLGLTPNEDISLAAAKQLCSFLEDSGVNTSIKSQAIKEITNCITEGGSAVRALLSTSKSHELEAIIRTFNEAEESKKHGSGFFSVKTLKSIGAG